MSHELALSGSHHLMTCCKGTLQVSLCRLPFELLLSQCGLYEVSCPAQETGLFITVLPAQQAYLAKPGLSAIVPGLAPPSPAPCPHQLSKEPKLPTQKTVNKMVWTYFPVTRADMDTLLHQVPSSNQAPYPKLSIWVFSRTWS